MVVTATRPTAEARTEQSGSAGSFTVSFLSSSAEVINGKGEGSV